MTTDKTPATLATAKHGGCAQLPTSERERFEAFAKEKGFGVSREHTGSERYFVYATQIAWESWQAALAAQPSPGGQGDALAALPLYRLADDANGNRGLHRDDTGSWVKLQDVERALAARQPVGEPVAWMTHHDEPMLFPTAAEASAYCEDDEQPVPLFRSPAQAVDLVPRSMGTAPRDGTMVRLLVQFNENATEDTAEPAWTIGACNDDNVGEDERIGWQFAGWCWTHDHFTEGKGTPVGWLPLIGSAQAVDLAPASIPDAPEVRDILGRPNFWCSPWANVLRMRGDAIPRKAEEEQAAVIRFMLNHYLAHGPDWAETAGAELDAIRKADSQAVGNK